MRVLCLLAAAALSVAALPDAHAKPQIVRAAPVRGDAAWSPRRLFNEALGQEEAGNLTRAVQLYLSARLSARTSFADELYARGAALRLVRILAGYDDDAAAASALLVAAEAPEGVTDLTPLIRTLMRRVDGSRSIELEMVRGRIISIRYKPRLEVAVVELQTENEEQRLFIADGTIGPFSAGDRVRALLRRDPTRALASHRLVALGSAAADGWQILTVSGLPGTPGPAYGALLD